MSDIAPGSRAGSQFGRYRLRRLLGRGRMGEVYEAQDTAKERLVALKLLSPAFSSDPAFRDRLEAEVNAAGQLREPHVIPINDCGEIDGQLFLEMPLIDGMDLSTLLQRLGKLGPPRAVAIVRQVAAALDGAHAAGVIHGDVKPQNILVTRDDSAYLADFGIAAAAAYNGAMRVGSWKYPAPERFTDIEVTHRVDVYALTCVLHECLTGSPGRLQAELPRNFDEVIAQGMAKDPQTRYATAGDLALAAQQALSAPDLPETGDIVESAPRRTPPVEPPPPTGSGIAASDSAWLGQFDAFSLRREESRKRKLRLALGAVVAVALLVIAGVIIRLLQSSHVSTTADSAIEPTPSTTEPTTPAPQVQVRLISLLPAGYPPGTCNKITPPRDALAAVSCGPNADLDGPASATYTLFDDAAKLGSAFNNTVATAGVMECPGRIQSPGPWHRNATPDKSSGTLLCATQQGQPTVTWTNEDALLLNSAKAGPDGPGIEQLYGWWMSHS